MAQHSEHTKIEADTSADVASDSDSDTDTSDSDTDTDTSDSRAAADSDIDVTDTKEAAAAAPAADAAAPVEAVEQRFWINTVSLEHVGIGVTGGFVQADHGSPTRLRWLGRGDWIVMHSPRVGMRAGPAVQAFTALGFIADDEPFQVRLGPDVEPWRRRVQWQPCIPAEVRPLLDDLTFVIDKKQWGYPFRRGLFRIGAADFTLIASTMATDWSAEGGRAAVAQPVSGAA